MKSFFLVLAMGALLMTSCNKEEKCQYTEIFTTALPTEITTIETYLASQGVTDATQHPTGVFYKINTVGTGAVANSLCNTVNLVYAAYKFNDPVAFDAYNNAAGLPLVLGKTILGVQKTLPLIKAGGTIILYIPPSLAYGSQAISDENGNVILPPNSYIQFNMTLVAVN